MTVTFRRRAALGWLLPGALSLMVGCASGTSAPAPSARPSTAPSAHVAAASPLASATPSPVASVTPSPVASVKSSPASVKSSAPRAVTPRPASLGPLRVELWGDSVSAQAAPYISAAFTKTGKATARLHTFPGTALCGWLDDVRTELDPANPAGFHPQVAVIQFSGDAFSPCMKDAHGVAYAGPARVDKYAADSAAAIALFRAARVPVYFTSTPISRDESARYTGLTPFGVMFSQLPGRFPAGHLVRYIDAANPLEWHGKFSLTLPCLTGETCTGRWPNGTKTVVVRQSDGTHFCPVAETVAADGSRSCPVFMPGAQRFAQAIERPVARDFGL